MDRGASNSLRTIASAPVLLVIALLASAVPILSVAYPPVLDYPNHLARIWLLSGKVDEAPLSAMYAADWSQTSTNFAVDFIASAAARVIPLGIVSTVLLLAMFLGPPAGAILLNRAIAGRWHVWQAAILFLAWSTTAIAGFLNFQIGLAAALLCAKALASRTAKLPVRLFPLWLASAVLLLAIHPFGLFFYAALGAGLTLGPSPSWPRSLGDAIPPAARIGMLAAACIIPLVALFLLAPTPPGVHASTASTILWSSWAKALDPLRLGKALSSPILTYDARIDLLLFVPLAACVVWAALSGRIRMHGGLLLAAVALLLLSCVVPEEIGDASWIQRRLPPMAALALAAAVIPARGKPRRGDALIPLVIGATLLLRIGWIESVWLMRRSDVAEITNAVRTVPRGASVVVVRQDVANLSLFPTGRLMAGGAGPIIETGRHFIVPLSVSQGFFIPTLFNVPGQQPVIVRPPWRAKSVYASAIPLVSELGTNARRDPYVLHWRRDFDYLLVINADLGRIPPWVARGTAPVSGPGFARLYRIRK